ncbi:hypothetical protein BpHYR1_036769 [Brachionus plicatilis]|uniref:Uncharacterized protein n=1 Tax=Brachionus plicatilis TaxID=10195 RepID=A0A3M7SZK3_BRAPC|nr:hypothetical protein BpHYR1_036769 [Brachionus plicatilis]
MATSFILANKNSNNNPAQQVLATQQEAINSSPNPFFIDQTKANFLLQNYHKNLGDTFSRLDELNEEEEEEEEEDFDDQGLDEELDNSNLEFSDHAGVYQLLNEYQDFDFDVKHFGKYDIGQLKKNYQLTFGKKSKMMRENDEDSLVFSSLNTAQKFNLDDYANNGHESYEDDLYDDEDNDDQANESVDPTSSYLDQISRDILFVNNTGDHSQLMDENILNWSMKLSSHDQFAKRSRSRSPKRAKQWKNFANFQSQNRLLSTQFQNFNQLKNFQQLKLEQEQEQSQSQQYNKKSLSTTSWGKLKNSKSNSSNIGLSNQKHHFCEIICLVFYPPWPNPQRLKGLEKKKKNLKISKSKKFFIQENFFILKFLFFLSKVAKNNCFGLNFKKSFLILEYIYIYVNYGDMIIKIDSVCLTKHLAYYSHTRPLYLHSMTKRLTTDFNYGSNILGIAFIEQFVINKDHLNNSIKNDFAKIKSLGPSYFGHKPIQKTHVCLIKPYLENNSSYGSKSVNSSHFAYTLASNPHLYKVYQNSKGNLNSSNLDETATSTSGSDLSFQPAHQRQSRTVPQETQSAKKTSFSQLKQRSVSSCAIAANAQPIDNSAMKKSIGIQHEPEGADGRQHDHSSTILCMVVDKNGKLNKKDLLMAAAKAKAMADQAGMLKIQRPKTPASSKRSSSLFNSKHSLPDLTFLTHYSDKKAQPPLSTPITKPSPPNPQSAPGDLLKRKTLKSIKRYRQTKQNTEPCAIQMADQAHHLNTEETTEFKFERRTSLPFNKRGKNPLHPPNGKQPLKSCLKRKESHLKHSQSLQNNFVQEETSLAKSACMFVPFVGHLFSCDTDSSTRYIYYNNLEKSRLSKMYKQLTGQLYEDEEENGEEDEAKFGKSRQPEITKSDNDVRIKKAVKFKAVRRREPPHVSRPAPLLQYDTLIAMLKSSKEKKCKSVSGLGGKNSNAIEADTISMASLSESPPSEFKFSDDEDNLVVKTNPSQPDKVEHVKNLKRNFHTILLKDQKLNNLKEILLELKTHQEKQAKFDPTHCSSTTSSASFSANSSSTSTCSSITGPLNTSLETKESIEKLAGYLFDFLKQSLKPPSTDCLLPTSNIFKSTIDSPLLSLKKPNQLAESNTLTQTFSQYTQMWNLIECTMNANLELQRQPIKSEGPAPKCYFFLPKEAYLTMFQEINKFASSTNQTYLIDNSINTSQLRRKHHFMS